MTRRSLPHPEDRFDRGDRAGEDERERQDNRAGRGDRGDRAGRGDRGVRGDRAGRDAQDERDRQDNRPGRAGREGQDERAGRGDPAGQDTRACRDGHEESEEPAYKLSSPRPASDANRAPIKPEIRVGDMPETTRSLLVTRLVNWLMFMLTINLVVAIGNDLLRHERVEMIPFLQQLAMLVVGYVVGRHGRS